MIMKFEGCRLTAYRCAAGVLTIGYGHTGADVTEGLTITQARAEELLKSDLTKFENTVNNVLYCPVTDQLNQNQFDALVSFTYNCGGGNLKNLCKNRNLEQISAAIVMYNKAAGKVLQGLVNRRAAEQALFNTPTDKENETKTEFKTECNVTPSTNCLLLQKAINVDKIASLTEDGKCGPKTKAAIQKICLQAKFNPRAGRFEIGSRGETVRFVQTRLGITEDGLFGPGTRTAVRGWQMSHELTVDGIVGPVTLISMI